MGKHRPTYTPHIDTGDYVIVTNVDKVVLPATSGKKNPTSGTRAILVASVMRPPGSCSSGGPSDLELAIQRMLPKSKLGRQMIDKLKLQVGRSTPPGTAADTAGALDADGLHQPEPFSHPRR